MQVHLLREPKNVKIDYFMAPIKQWNDEYNLAKKDLVSFSQLAFTNYIFVPEVYSIDPSGIIDCFIRSCHCLCSRLIVPVVQLICSPVFLIVPSGGIVDCFH